MRINESRPYAKLSKLRQRIESFAMYAQCAIRSLKWNPDLVDFVMLCLLKRQFEDIDNETIIVGNREYYFKEPKHWRRDATQASQVQEMRKTAFERRNQPDRDQVPEVQICADTHRRSSGERKALTNPTEPVLSGRK